MTLAEEREELIEMMAQAGGGDAWTLSTNFQKDRERHKMRRVLTAISAAGLSIVGPKVTDDMFKAAYQEDPIGSLHSYYDCFKAMLAAGDLARKPE